MSEAVSPGGLAAQVARGAGLFRLPARGVIAVAGGDRVRWLNGMITGDVAALAAAGPGAGCYALLLTVQGRIVADLHVLARPERLLLETERAAVGSVIGQLEKYIVADDVELSDASGDIVRLAVEGPRAPAVLAAVTAQGEALADRLEPEQHEELAIAGAPTLVLRAAFSVGPGFQLFAPAPAAEDVAAALLEAGRGEGLVEAGPEVLELLRVEAGAPRLGRELDETVLPAEARLGSAVSTTKGCYTGQEVVERLRSRGVVKHLLIGLRFAGDETPESGDEIRVEGAMVGEVTSAARSPRFGAIALGYVRSEHAEPGTAIEAGGLPGRVAELPFLHGSSESDGSA